MPTCPFCERIGAGKTIADNALAVAFWDEYPVSPGHALVVPRRHETDFFGLSGAEQGDVWALLNILQARIAEDRSPQGFNVGVNVGRSAGQTIEHAHVHLIPRYEGDVPDPRGGVRWVLPERADYWSGRT